MNRRVVVTGIGALTPIGNNSKDFWESAKKGKLGVDFIKRFETDDFKVKVAAELKDFTPEDHLDRKEVKRMDLFSQYAMVAADEAVKDSELNIEKIDNDRFGVLVGSGIGGLNTIEEQTRRLIDKGPSKVAPLFIPTAIVNMAAGNIAIKYKAQGMCMCIVTACATGTNCIGEAFRSIKHGYSDVMIAGGSESSITRIGIAGFTNLTTLSHTNIPERSSIPFDKERSGFVMGEGAGIVILEEYEHAIKRDAKIYGEIVGYGLTCDAYHMTNQSPDGSGAAKAMKLALEEGNVGIDEVTYINAHGTSTEVNDKTETLAIKNVFGEKAYDVPVSSMKSMFGHMLGAAGAVETIGTLLALRDNFVTPTIGYKEKDDLCDLDYVPNTGRPHKMKYALNNSFGFGGHNAVLCLKKWER